MVIDYAAAWNAEVRCLLDNIDYAAWNAEIERLFGDRYIPFGRSDLAVAAVKARGWDLFESDS